MNGPVILNRQRRHRVSVSRLLQFVNLLSQRLRLDSQTFTIVLVSDRAIRRLNRDFRNQNKPTDVLSFPTEPQDPLHLEKPGLGDMILSIETARRQALARHHSLERELCVLAIHGLLHLLGYDHEVDRGEMRRKELKLQRELL
ncbi:MAG: rRNA maturation RNase YbeY [Acidobacteria bacterium]|nr:rRNA maturation RNase YbeY [Acidobacteriota bacterium]